MNKLIRSLKFHLRSKEAISPRRRNTGIVLIVLIVTLGIIGGAITTASTVLNLTVTNPTALEVTDQILPVSILTSSFAANDDMLNTHMHEGSLDIPDMPGTSKINLVAAWAEPTSGGDVDQTTASQSIAVNDMNLPHLADDEYTFALHNPATVLHTKIGQKYVGSALTVTWSYCDTSNATTCTSWVALTNVVDSSVGFSKDGQQTLQWDIPLTGAWGKENHKSVAGYWVQAKITNTPAGSPTPPKGTLSQYETGQWWTYTDSLMAGQTLDYQLYYGGLTDFKAFHYYFPGFDGVVTADDADLEPGTEWNVKVKQNLIIDSNETGKIISKVGALDLTYTAAAAFGGTNTITIGVTGAGVNTFFGEFTHSEEDGGSYFSGTAEESYSKSLYKASSNYISSRQVDDADILSNTSSEVTSHKIGQAYDTTTNTTSVFGAKLDDPS